MNNKILLFILIPVTVIITAILYMPVSITLYKLSEPYFGYPIKTEGKPFPIRHDALGDGEFGAKRRNGRFHSGIDIQADVGTPVYAAKSGIAFRGNVPMGYGKYIMIYHPDGFLTMYGHLSDWSVYSTQKVHKGDLIGFTGKTGNSASKLIQPHLHFEIRKKGEPVDPAPLMR